MQDEKYERLLNHPRAKKDALKKPNGADEDVQLRTEKKERSKDSFNGKGDTL